MRKTLALSAAIICCLAIASTAMATLPCAANSSCVIEVENSNGCTTADLRWCPLGDMDHIIIHVTVRNCLDDPLEGCAIRLDLDGEADAQDEMGVADIAICGTQSMTSVSDANGAVAFILTGGGCGRFILNWTATAECADPEVELCANSTELCVKSPDFNGDLRVQFVDTFKFLPMLSAGAGWCGDLNCDGDITFPDAFRFLPLIGTSGSCIGAPAPEGNLKSCE